jgi:hypothetical protein
MFMQNKELRLSVCQLGSQSYVPTNKVFFAQKGLQSSDQVYFAQVASRYF